MGHVVLKVDLGDMPTPPSTQPSNRRKYWILGVVAPFFLALDQWTKGLVLEKFQLGETLQLTSFFNLTYVRNTGAAFGILSDAHPEFRVPFFTAVPLIALVTIGYIFKKLKPEENRLALALALVVSGAIGNFIDRIKYGYVVDFLDFHWNYEAHFPAFNVADSAICVGVGLLMLDMLRQK